MAKISVLDDNYPSLIQHFDLSETINENSILLDKSFNKNNSLKVSNPPTIEYDENLKRNVSVFNGRSNYIPIGKASKVTDAITINALAYVDDWDNYKGTIISCTESGGWNFFDYSTKKFYLYIKGSGYTTYSIPLDYLVDTWNMITMSFDGYNIKYYINGNLINSISVSSNVKKTIGYVSVPIYIGAEAFTGSSVSSGSYFNGKIADIRIYNEALSDEEIFLLYNYLMYKDYNYIKQDDRYYGFSDDNYNTDTQMYNEITLDNINSYLYGNSVSNLTTEVTIGDETFKPIDKFDNFKIVSKYNTSKSITGRKTNSSMAIANGDIYTKVVSNIDSFTLSNTTTNSSYIKMAVSFDNGSTWKTYKDKKFTDLSVTIPIKTYEDMSTEEKSNWNTAKETIMTNGFTPTELESIDFNIIENLSTIRFAYVLYQDLSTDTCEVNNLSWQFDAKGSFQKMKDSEITTSFSNGVINLIPNENQDMIITNYVYGALNGN